MIILEKQAPLLVLEKAFLGDIRLHRTSDATRGTLLLPMVSNGTIVPEAFQISWEYRLEDLTPSFLELLPSHIPEDVAALPKSTRVPYALFMYSDIFYRNHLDQLQLGHTAHALIRKLTTMRK